MAQQTGSAPSAKRIDNSEFEPISYKSTTTMANYFVLNAA